jgi:hypothetical protein
MPNTVFGWVDDPLVDWRKPALDTLETYARSHEYFIIEEVIEEYERGNNPEVLPDNRKWGEITKKAAKACIITKTNQGRESKASNMSIARIWKSNVYIPMTP